MGRQFMFIVAYDEETGTWFHDVGSEEYRYPDGTVWDESTGDYDTDETTHYEILQTMCRSLTAIGKAHRKEDAN